MNSFVEKGFTCFFLVKLKQDGMRMQFKGGCIWAKQIFPREMRIN